MLAVVAATGRSRRTRIGLPAAAVVLALVIGVSRIYLGAHWPTDVLAGYALAAGWLAMLFALRLRHRSVQRPPAQPASSPASASRP
jgi:undecaprenyl-diphosphatase